MFWKKLKAKEEPVKVPDQIDPARRFAVANWKCHKNLDEAQKWFDDFAAAYQPNPNLTVIIAPPIMYLERAANFIKEFALPSVHLAAQDVSPFPRGSYTGAVAADMLKGLADYVIVGQRERRRYFHETSQDVANKVLETVDAGLIPIICVDSSYAQSQLAVLNDLDTRKVIISYEPETADFNIPQKADKIGEFVSYISEIHPGFPLLYGSEVQMDELTKYTDIDGVAGLMAGSSSLDPKQFAEICRIYA